MLYFTERPHCLLAKLNSLGLRGLSEVNSREKESKSICSGENFERGWRYLSRSSVLQSKKDLTSPLEGTGQSSGLIWVPTQVGTLMQNAMLLRTHLRENWLDIKTHAQTPLLTTGTCPEKLSILAGPWWVNPPKSADNKIHSRMVIMPQYPAI